MKKILKLYGSPFARDNAMRKDKKLWDGLGTFYMSNKYAFIADIEYRYIFVQSGSSSRGIRSVNKIVQCCNDIPHEHVTTIVGNHRNAPYERRIDESINNHNGSTTGRTRLQSASKPQTDAELRGYKLSASELKYGHLSGIYI